ncbi:hypothetical protein [Burkholderia cenocepacia]|uniref:hypothetical protein n=1 Tax=Burkholderia cenocepacia TaxID=95486 RepID=UPI002ABD9FE9|nr:hypothetical protein [Burkholderia cenocepacia]
MAGKQGKQGKRAQKALPRAILVFGEDDNDRECVRHLVEAIWPEVPAIKPRRAPLILQKGKNAAEHRKNAHAVADVVKASNVTLDVVAVMAHQDCDAVEPAHEPLSKQIERELTAAGVPLACAVTPAWEFEAWWYLWPDAVASVNARWRRLTRTGEEVGLIVNAKETLRGELRPRPKDKPTADYSESDGPRIASAVREGMHINSLKAKSASFSAFRERVLEIKANIEAKAA